MKRELADAIAEIQQEVAVDVAELGLREEYDRIVAIRVELGRS